MNHIDFRRELQRRIINDSDGVFLDELWAYILKTCNYRTTGLLLNADQQWSETEDSTGAIVPICCLVFRGAPSPLLDLDNRPYLLDLLATLAATGTDALMIVDKVSERNAVFRWHRLTGWSETSKEIAR